MAAIASTNLIIHGLQRSKATALYKKAKSLGVTPEDYVKDLIATDLELDLLAKTKTFAELAAPFQKSLAGLSESDLDTLSRPSRSKARR